MIYEKVLKLCGDRKVSVSKLEKDCGLGNATVRGWRESDPRVSKVKAVADYFGVTVDDLIREQ